MNNEEARRILSLYRPGGMDAGDPYFEEALKQARRDPELARWFERERQFDRRISDSLQGIAAPPDGKANLLAAGNLELRRRRIPQWPAALAAAVMLAAGLFFAWHAFDGGERESLPVARAEGVDAFLEMAASAMPFGFRADSVAGLSLWLEERGAPVPDGLPDRFNHAEAVGCQVFDGPGGEKISLLCLMMNGEVVHLFVMGDETQYVREWPRETWREREGWNAYAWSGEGRSYVILSRAPRNELEPWLKEV